MRLLKLSNEEYLIIDGDNAKYFSKPEKVIQHFKSMNLNLTMTVTGAIISMEKNDHNAADITENSYLTEKI